MDLKISPVFVRHVRIRKKTLALEERLSSSLTMVAREKGPDSKCWWCPRQPPRLPHEYHDYFTGLSGNFRCSRQTNYILLWYWHEYSVLVSYWMRFHSILLWALRELTGWLFFAPTLNCYSVYFFIQTAFMVIFECTIPTIGIDILFLLRATLILKLLATPLLIAKRPTCLTSWSLMSFQE